MGAGVGIVEAVRFPMAKFGCDPKEGTFSVMEVRIPSLGVALVAATAPWGLFSRSPSITGLDISYSS